MSNPVTEAIKKELDSLKEQIKTQKETIASGIFTTPKEKVDAKVALKELEEKADLAAWKLSKEIM